MIDFGRISLIIYGLLLLIGGIVGYRAANSVWSLVSGAISAVVLAVIYFALARSQPKTAFGLGLVIAIGWAVFFFLRIVKAGKFMPAGGPAILSLLATVIFGLALMKASANPPL
jgi:uncharacterized membrane protein (UPF0136 family)